MFSFVKLFCLLSSVWHVSVMTTVTTIGPPIDNHTNEAKLVININEPLNLDDFCWSELVDSCSIIGNFAQPKIGLNFPVNIDCTMHFGRSDELQRPFFDKYLHKRFERIEKISLNGCGVNVEYRRQHSNYRNLLGIEYIPDPKSVRHLALEMFRVHGDLNRGAFSQFTNIETLLLTKNKIDGLNDDSFRGLSQARELIIDENNIQSIHPASFQACNESLKRLVIRENSLNLGALMPLKNLTEFEISTKQINWTATITNINTLKTLIISNVRKIVHENKATPRTFQHLTELEVLFCNLTEFPIDRYPQMHYFNVSHNALKNITIKEMQMRNLLTLDISFNNFTCIDNTLLMNLRDLEYFYASHNKIRSINAKAFQNNYNLKVVDLRFNQLEALNIDSAAFITAKRIQFLIDQNNFNCAWINDFYAIDPHIFETKFIYTKDFSNMNIRGLQCIYFSDDYRYHSFLYGEDEYYHNGLKPRRPPQPIEIIRRNPRRTAYVTICVLIVGVSFLLISLYFFVKYRTLTTTLNHHSIYGTDKQPNKDFTDMNIGNRPDIIQDRVISLGQCEDSSRFTMMKSASSPRSIYYGEDQASFIEFKDSFREIAEQRKASLPNRFECVPIGTQRVIFNIEPDTLEY